MSTDRRKSARNLQRFPVTYTLASGVGKGFVVNQSEKGLFIRCSRILRPGSPVTVYLESENVTIKGRVVWNRQPVAQLDQNVGGMGIEVLESIADAHVEAEAAGPSFWFKCEGINIVYPSTLAFLSHYLEDLKHGIVELPLTLRAADHGEWMTWNISHPAHAMPLELSGVVVSVEKNHYIVSLAEGSLEDLRSHVGKIDLVSSNDIFTESQEGLTEGPLTPMLVPKLLASLARQGTDASLKVSARGLEKTIYLKAGLPTYVKSSLAQETLGNFLMEHGIISTQEFIQTTPDRETTQSRSLNLMQSGVLDGSKIFQSLVEHQTYKLSRTFAWLEGRYEVTPLTAWPEHIAHLSPQSPLSLFEATAAAYPQEFAMLYLKNEFNRHLVLKDEAFFMNMGLPTQLFKFIRSAHGTTVGAIQEKTGDSHALSYVLSLLLWGWANLQSDGPG